jgi:hypothetical protein
VGIGRDEEGEVTGFFGYEGDEDLTTLTEQDRALWPELSWLRDGVDPLRARVDHPVIGPLDELVDRWCERRDLGPLSLVLPAYLQGPSGLPGWEPLLGALENIRDGADASPGLPSEDLVVVSRLVEETARIIRPGRRG